MSPTREVFVYLAAPYYRKAEIQAAKQALQEWNPRIVVTSRWMEEPHAANTQTHEVSPKLHEQYAMDDLEDVYQADMIVSFTEETAPVGVSVDGDTYNRAKRGGRHVEFGFALGLGKELVLIGPRENIFHFLPQVKQYNTFAEFMTQYKLEAA